jgi:predicted O-methyltransferase YrrM
MNDIITGTGADGTTTPIGQGPLMTREKWGNDAYIAGNEFEATMRAYMHDASSILELGSGWTTIVLSQELPDTPTTALEHHEGWYERVVPYAPNVRVLLQPLVDFGEFEWYEWGWPINQAPYDLLLVDGPPRATTKGGRSGALYALEYALAPGCVIIVDDATPEVRYIAKWIEDFDLTVVEQVVNTPEERVLVLEYPGPRPVAT